jgi:hypothetical protein
VGRYASRAHYKRRAPRFIGSAQVLETEAKPRWSWLPYALVAYNVAFTAVYLLLPAYFSFFVLTFIGMCVVVFARCLRLYR